MLYTLVNILAYNHETIYKICFFKIKPNFGSHTFRVLKYTREHLVINTCTYIEPDQILVNLLSKHIKLKIIGLSKITIADIKKLNCLKIPEYGCVC